VTTGRPPTWYGLTWSVGISLVLTGLLRSSLAADNSVSASAAAAESERG